MSLRHRHPAESVQPPSALATLTLRAPAKLNLYLRVVGKRPDGYHELETLFERIDLADELSFEPAETLTLTCDASSLSAGDDNLVLKAARALQQAVGVSRGARIRLAKRAPVAAGLGGGSSDAATALLGLNELWGLRWPRERLLPLGRQLGADVPFFLMDARFAIGRERGDVCAPLAVPPEVVLWHVLAVPNEPLLTRDVFAALNLSLTPPGPPLTMCAQSLLDGHLPRLAQTLRNDLELPASQRCPRIASLKARLQEGGAIAVSLSGSGPSVFGLVASEEDARRLAARIASPSDAWRVFVCRTR